ncbi:MAG: hypothetical protein J1F11_01400 [Oscillospiraceae bacterium]|nr:hypothetical protein [Oscillospiraceae bacterium]
MNANCMYANSDLRRKAKESGVTFWQIADYMGVCEMTISRRFRRELSEKEKTEMNGIIDSLAAQKNASH